ncbi:MAG: hypothetical protein WCZ89_04335 [Phycisphaerae bacterium]
MKDYWLAKLISSVDVVNSRKKLQKIIYLLYKSGCPLQCEYILHYYGPYSFELAGLVDKLKSSKLIEENPEQQRTNVISYRSKMSEQGKKKLREFEESTKGKSLLNNISPFISQFQELNKEKMRVLELAATIAFFHDGNWQEAKRQTAAFKKVKIGDSKLEEAFTLAKKFKKSA